MQEFTEIVHKFYDANARMGAEFCHGNYSHLQKDSLRIWITCRLQRILGPRLDISAIIIQNA